MKWKRITDELPENKSDCIVLTKRGRVIRVERNKRWVGGFRDADGSPRNPGGYCVDDATHYILFKDLQK